MGWIMKVVIIAVKLTRKYSTRNPNNHDIGCSFPIIE